MRAKITDTPAAYPWSSYHAFTGKQKPPHWLKTKRLLSQFGRGKKDAITSYRSYVEEGEADALEDPHKDIVGGLILGDTGFIDWVKEQSLSFRDEEQEIPQLKKLKPRPSLETIVRVVSDEMRCSEEKIFEKGRHKNIGREMAIFLARDFSGVSCKALGKYFGAISGPAITLSPTIHKFANEFIPSGLSAE